MSDVQKNDNELSSKSLVSKNDEKYKLELKNKTMQEFSRLNDEYMDSLVDYIFEGYKNSFAYILAYLDENRRKKVLDAMDEKLKKDVEKYYNEIPREIPISDNPDVLAECAQAIKKMKTEGMTYEGIEKSISKLEKNYHILNECAQSFSETNPILYLNLKNSIFDMEDLTYLDDRSIQRILREIDSDDLCKALKPYSCEDEIPEKIFKNMSRRAADMLKEEMEFMGPVRYSDIQEAQNKIFEILNSLSKSGEIIFSRNTNL